MPATAAIGHRPTQRFAAASPAYELYAPRGPRLRALATVLLGALLSLLAVVRSQAVMVEFADFSSAGNLTLNGDSEIVNTSDGQVLRLVPAAGGQSGNAWGTIPLSVASFSTAFEFRITNPGGIADNFGQSGADGFTFIVQKEGVNVVGSSGIALGIGGISPSIAVEFDTFSNSEISTNHVGIDLNGNVNSVATADFATRFDNGQKYTAWIDYDGSVFELRVSADGIRPASALLTHSINLVGALDSSTAFVGFTASTGSAFGNYDILQWAYSDSFVPGGVNVPNAVPEPATMTLIGLGLGLVLLRTRSGLSRSKRA